MNRMGVLVVAALVVSAVPAAADPGWRASLETDPTDPVFFQGWSLFSTVRPPGTKWAVRVGVHDVKLPELFSGPANKGWTVELRPAATALVQRYFGEGRGGLFVQAGAGFERTILNAPSGRSVELGSLSAHVGVGYRWLPFEQLGLVVAPTLSLSAALWHSGEPVVGDEKFQPPPVNPIPEMLVGWEFGGG